MPSFHRHSRSAEAHQPDHVVREVGHQDAGDHVELEETDQPAAPFGGRNLRNVHRPEHRGAADAEPSDEPEEHERIPIPGEGAANRGDQVEDGHAAQAVAAPVAVARDAGQSRAEDRADQRARYREPEAVRRQIEDSRERVRGPGNHRRIESEKQPAQCRHDGALDQCRGEFHRFACSARINAPSTPACPPSCGGTTNASIPLRISLVRT